MLDKNKKTEKTSKSEKVEDQEKMAIDNKLSDLAKQIIDKDLIITEKDKLIEQQDKLIKQYKTDMQVMAQEYKTQLVLKMEDANKMIKCKMDENDKKLKEAIADAKKYAIKDQALQLIDIINQFEIACNYKLEDEKLINYQKGFKIFLSMFYNLFDSLHIKQIKPDLGVEFDPNLMQCFETVADPSKANNTIYELIHTGYKLYDYILKPALVKVIKNN